MRRGGKLILLLVLCFVMLGIGVAQISDAERKFIYSARQFLATEAGGGDKNGLSNYLRAFEMFDTNIYVQHQAVFERILKQGWTGREQKEKELLRSLQPVLAELWRGNEKQFVRYPPVVSDPLNSKMPNLLKCQLLDKLLIIQAKYCEHIGKIDYALNWSRHSLIFAQRMVDNQTPLICKLVSIRSEGQALGALAELLLSVRFDAKTYREIAGWLQELEQKEVPLWRALELEARSISVRFRQMEQMLQSPEQIATLKPEEKKKFEYIKANRDRLLKELNDYWSVVVVTNQKPYPEFARVDLRSMAQKLDPMLGSMPNLMEGRVRECSTKAQWRLTTALAQALAYRAEKSRFPGSLGELSSIGMSAPLDPFTMNPLIYQSDGKHGLIYSLGPDMQDNKAQVEYDPTNGTVSPGDIILRF